MLFFSKQKGTNVFVSLLTLLNVKHTNKFSNRYFNEHPHKYNLFGISKMLSDYGVENAGLRVNDIENDIYNIQTPFIAHIGTDFVVVTKTGTTEINYIWNGKKISLPPKQFLQTWTGIVLLAESTSYSIEPGYKGNRKIEVFNTLQTIFLGFFILTLGVCSYLSHYSIYNTGIIFSIIINVIGMYIGYLLILKQIHAHSDYSDKICSLFKHSDCNNILESKVAKVGGIIGWSEIGFGYFISNLLLLIFLPQLMPYLAFINICTLPYTIWSIWYQKVKAKQWCPLCLIVQLLLWLIFVNNIIFSFIQIPVFGGENILWITCIYLIPVLGISLYIPKIYEGNKSENLNQEINSIKSNEKVFNALLQNQPMYPVDRLSSQIVFGNPTGIPITMLTNPHCNPCSTMHARVEKLMEDSPGKYCIQYIFSSFNEELSKSSKWLIAVYLNNNEEKAKQIFSEWFENARLNKTEVLFCKYKYNIKDEKIMKEFHAHEQWINDIKLQTTPTILINGYKLPDNYKVEDLKYFSKLDIG